jgi:hypothetical protein
MRLIPLSKVAKIPVASSLFTPRTRKLGAHSVAVLLMPKLVDDKLILAGATSAEGQLSTANSKPA